MAALKRRRPGRPAQSAVSAEAIVKEALTLLEERGITGVSMRAIAQRLSVDPMSLYHYFPDKEALLREAAAVAYAGFEAPASRSASPRKRLEALGGAYLTFVEQRGELLRYVERASQRRCRASAGIRCALSRSRGAPGLVRAAPSIAQGAFVDSSTASPWRRNREPKSHPLAAYSSKSWPCWWQASSRWRSAAPL